MITLSIPGKEKLHLIPADLTALAARYVQTLQAYPADTAPLLQQSARSAKQWLKEFVASVTACQHIWSASTVRFEQKTLLLLCKLQARHLSRLAREITVRMRRTAAGFELAFLQAALTDITAAAAELKKQAPLAAQEHLRGASESLKGWQASLPLTMQHYAPTVLLLGGIEEVIALLPVLEQKRQDLAGIITEDMAIAKTRLALTRTFVAQIAAAASAHPDPALMRKYDCEELLRVVRQARIQLRPAVEKSANALIAQIG